MKNAVQGTATRVLVGLDPGAVEEKLMALVTTPWPKVRVSLEGFEGDKHAGLTYQSSVRTPHYPRGTVIRNTRQISIVSTHELDLIAVALGVPVVLPEWLGANLVIRGIPDLTQLPPSTRLFFPQDTVLVVDGENMPCVFPGNVIQAQYPAIGGLAHQFPKMAIHRRGVVAWVERPGLVTEGDRVVARIPPQVMYSIPNGSAKEPHKEQAPDASSCPVSAGVSAPTILQP